MSIFFSAIALLAFLFGGNRALAAKGHPPIEKLLIVYLVGGVSAGALAGVFAPWARSTLRSAICGVVATIPMGLAWRIAQFGLAPWTRGDTFVIALGSVLIGGGWGIITYRAFRPHPASRG